MSWKPTSLIHPMQTGAGEVNAPDSGEQHLQTGEKCIRIDASLVVDQPLVHNERAVWRQRVIGFPQQHLLGRKVPIVQYTA